MVTERKREHHSYKRGGRPKSDQTAATDAPEAPEAPIRVGSPAARGRAARASARATAAAGDRAPVRRDQRKATPEASIIRNKIAAGTPSERLGN